MLAKIKEFFREEISADDQAVPQERLELAAAALMIEVASADEDYGAAELATLTGILRETFQLDQQRIDELTTLAHEEKDSATSLYQFTYLINQQATPEQKFEILNGMWRVAYADGSLDKYEEHIIRKVAELLYIPHSEFIRAKHLARNV